MVPSSSVARARDQADLQLAVRDGSEEARLDLGGVVHARRHALRQQLEQEGLFAGGRVLDQLDQFGHLLGRQRQRRDAERGAFGGVLTVGGKHGGSLGSRS
ncbi:hypothetical protein MASR1M6_39540 [Rubrivivax sp.]